MNAEMILEDAIDEMYQMESMINYNMFGPPFTINTLTLWRDVHYLKLKKALSEDIPLDKKCQYKTKFADKIDNSLFFSFKAKIHKQYEINLLNNKQQIQDIFANEDQKIIQQTITKNLGNVINQIKQIAKEYLALTKAYAKWQVEIEYTYDLFRRLQLYDLIQFEKKMVRDLDSLPFSQQQEKKNTFFNNLIDKIVRNKIIFKLKVGKVFTNIQEISKTSIQDKCSRAGLLQQGASYAINFLSRGFAGIKLIQTINLEVMIGGIIAQTVVGKISDKMLEANLKAKIEEQIQKIQEISQYLKDSNQGLDQLIWQAISQCDKLEIFQKLKEQIKLFLLKFYKVSVDPNMHYNEELDNFMILEEDEDGGVIITQSTKQIITLPVEEPIINLSQKIEIKKDYI